MALTASRDGDSGGHSSAAHIGGDGDSNGGHGNVALTGGDGDSGGHSSAAHIGGDGDSNGGHSNVARTGGDGDSGGSDSGGGNRGATRTGSAKL